MRIESFEDAGQAALAAAVYVARAAREAIAARGRFVFAVSGGSTPGPMLRALAAESIDWGRVHVVQVDERIAPDGDPSRNFTRLEADLLAPAAIGSASVHPMPVTDPDPQAGAREYAALLARLGAGVIDLAHLGLGGDGHTASLVPGDPVLAVEDRDVAITGEYQGRRRMTLTYPALERARGILWLLAGSDKRDPLGRLIAGDRSIPAGRLGTRPAVVFADRAAADGIEGDE